MIAIIAACFALTLGIAGFVLLPMLRRLRGPQDAGQFDRAVYRDQITELEQDVARGLVPADAAEGARVEIERRLLGTARPTAPATGPRRSLRLASATAIVLVFAPAAIYWRLGAPSIPDLIANRASAQTPTAAAPPDNSQHDLQKSATALAEKLKTDPNNPERWMLYARTTATLGQWEISIDAYKQVLRLMPGEPDVLAGLGEMLVMQADGIVTPAARDNFQAVIAKRPTNDVARFYLALADAQSGLVKPAIEAWLKLAAETPADSEMRDEIARRVAEAAKIAGIPAPPMPAGTPAEMAPEAKGGPDADAVAAAAANLPPGQRDAMVENMVAQLAAKMAANPGDFDGWLRLGRAYLVLHDAAKSADAYAHATALQPGNVSVKLQEAIAIVDTLDETAQIPERAQQLFRDVQAADPKKVETWWYLGIASARAGDRAAAAKSWTYLLTLLTDPDDRKMVEGALKNVQ